jgi:predicted metal-dependent phosphoesterase TrpH
VVESVDEAFADLLSNSSKYYVPKQDMPVLDAIRLIRLANGVPVIAHPWARKRGSILDEATLAALVGAGMLGIEVDHVDHSAEDRIRLRALAAELGVFATGSSDYHGHNKPNRLGDEVTDSRVLELIVEAASGVEPIQSPAR